jgi:Domain of unknown function (DUF6362)
MIPAISPAWLCPTCGNALPDACNTPGPGCRIDSEWVQAKLEQAGSTLMALRTKSPFPTEYGCSWPQWLYSAADLFDWPDPTEAARAARPSASAIDSMDYVFTWLKLIPKHRGIVGRIVAARALVHPVTGKHLCHWRRVAKTVGADYRACQRWHEQGIRIITERLRP